MYEGGSYAHTLAAWFSKAKQSIEANFGLEMREFASCINSCRPSLPVLRPSEVKSTNVMRHRNKCFSASSPYFATSYVHACRKRKNSQWHVLQLDSHKFVDACHLKPAKLQLACYTCTDVRRSISNTTSPRKTWRHAWQDVTLTLLISALQFFLLMLFTR